MLRRVSRRRFLHQSGLALGGFAVGGISACGPVGDRSVALKRLGNQLTGNLIVPEDQGYESARHIWNGAIDRYPLAIARCAGVEDVQRSIAFARKHEVPLAVRGGGHHAAGFGTVDGGLVIDLSSMSRIQIEPEAQTCRVGPGVLAGNLHRETQPVGLVLPTGTVSTVGLAGLTLGGGEGLLASRFGLTCDNLISAEVVTAAGEVMHVSEMEEPELFWGLQGGGGNFGVVTSFQFRLHELMRVFAGMLTYRASEAGDVVRNWRDSLSEPSEYLSSMVIFSQVPEPTLLVVLCYTGDDLTTNAAVDPLRIYGSPTSDGVGPMSVLDLHTMFDAGSPSGSANFWQSHYCRDLPDEAIDTWLEHCRSATSPESASWILRMHGAWSRKDPTDTPYPHRDAHFTIGISAKWPFPSRADLHVAWARQLWTDLLPFATGQVYANWSTDLERVSTSSVYGPNLPRLRSLKQRFDPANVFSGNFNLTPS